MTQVAAPVTVVFGALFLGVRRAIVVANSASSVGWPLSACFRTLRMRAVPLITSLASFYVSASATGRQRRSGS